MSKATEDQLNDVHGTLIAHFADILQNGELVEIKDRESGEITHVRVKPSAAMYNQIRQFLKDNHVETAPGKSKPMANLASKLPFAGTEGDDEGEPTGMKH